MVSKKKVTTQAFLHLVSIAILTGATVASIHHNVEAATFNEVEALVKRAQSENAATFSPQNFKAGQEAYERAIFRRDEGKSEAQIQKYLDRASRFFEEAISITSLTKSNFPEFVAAYEAAVRVDTPQKASELHEEAMVAFNKTVKKIEKEKLEKASKFAHTAAQLFRRAELQVIRNDILTSAYNLRTQAEAAGCSINTPGLYEEAVRKIQEVEEFLERNRNNRETATLMADDVIITLTHAIYLSQWINRVLQEPDGWEDLMLQFEWYIDDISARLELSPDFNRDWTFAVEAILKTIRSLQEDLRYTEKQLTERDEEIGRLEAELNDFRSRSGQYAAELEVKRQQLLDQQRYEAKFERLTSIFKPREGEIFKATAGGRNQIVIRLTSMHFKSGSAVIAPEDTILLDKVHQVIRDLPSWEIEIQGHTDSMGKDKSNLDLSQARADAVKEYMVNTYRIDLAKIQAIGYGESRPLASNENAEGRAQNRRIEVILREP